MLSSLKKWVQDVAVDLAPPPSTSSIPESTHHYFYSTTPPANEYQESRKSSASAVYLSRPISLDSMGSSRMNIISIPPPLASPVEVDLSHLNREEQEHIANVLRRARAVEEQQQLSSLPSVTVPSLPSPSASIPSSLSSSSTSTSSFTSEQLEKYDNEISVNDEKSEPSLKSLFLSIHQCQLCGREHQENTMLCFQCLENQSIDRELEINNTFLDEQLISINKSLSENNEKIMNNDCEEQSDRNQSIIHESLSRTNHLTEIDENDFFYEEPSPYQVAILANSIEESNIPSYQIDELIDDDDQDERDHVKELEITIANLTRHLPLENIQLDLSPSIPMKKIEIDSREIESTSFHHPPLPLGLSISIPTPMNNHRTSLSRSSGIKDHLTDLLIPASPKVHPPLQRTFSTQSKRMLSINRHKRNLPSLPDGNHLQLRRANSESRFRLPAVPAILDDECDLLEIDLNDPMGSIDRTLRSKTDPNLEIRTDNNQTKVKQIRDQTTNTPPMSSINSSIKSKKNSKKTKVSPSNNIPPVVKLEKSTSTEMTYPFPVTKLILNPSRHGLGFRITGGHSHSNCTEVTACIQEIEKNHRNYQILENIVQEGEEVLELGGVSLRGKSTLFVENLMKTIKNEFEIIVRNQSAHSFLPTDNNIQRRHSVDTSLISVTNNTGIRSKSKSISSLKRIETIPDEDERPVEETIKPSNEEPSPVIPPQPRASLLPRDRGINGAKKNPSIDRQNSNDSDDSDSLSHYFYSSQGRKDSLIITGGPSVPHGRSQSVTPMVNYNTTASARLQNFLKSDPKRPTRGSTSIERKSSLAFASLNFLKKKTKSVDFSHQKNVIVNQLRANDYVGDIELQIGHDSEREQLVIRLIRAKNLLPKDTNGFSDPFVKIYLLPGREYVLQINGLKIPFPSSSRTMKLKEEIDRLILIAKHFEPRHIAKTLNPVWDQTVIYAHMHREEVQYKKLEITVWDYDRFKANDFLGQVTIDLKNPDAVNDKPHWYRLQASRAREEITNRGSSPRLFKMTSLDSSASLTVNKNSVNPQARSNQPK